jgi:hypothetical protein
MEPNEVPATPVRPTLSPQREEALWWAYMELATKHKEAMNFMKAIGVYEMYSPGSQYTNVH